MEGTKPIGILRTSFTHKCPACGQGDIYGKLLEVNSKCSGCGIKLKNHDAGDGPVFFAMFFAGAIVTFLAFLIEIYFRVPLLLHIVIWFPVTIGLSIFLLKIVKSCLIAVEYKHNRKRFDEK